MRVDLQTLAALNRLAQDGATEAAAGLSGLTGIETTVEVARISFVPATDAWRTPNDDGVGVRVGLSGAFEGETVLAFDRESARTVVSLLTGEPEFDESVVREVGNIVTSGFIDGWAEQFDTPIDITPPTLVDEPQAATDGPVAAFASRIETVDGAVSFRFNLLPKEQSLLGTLEESTDESSTEIAVEQLAGFAQLIHHGATTVSESLSSMTDIETVVDISEVSYVPIEQTTRSVDEGAVVGTVAEFTGPPGGFVAILFSEPGAQRLVSALVADAETDEPFDEMGQSAITEIGNVMASSFLDGWANVLETTIDPSPPRFVHDLGGAVLDPVVAHLGTSQEYAFACNGTVEADEEGFDCTIFALPQEDELSAALADLEVARVKDGSAERL